MESDNGKSFLRQLSVGSSPSSYYPSKKGSRRWGASSKKNNGNGYEDSNSRMLGIWVKKRVIVVIEENAHAKHAMMWALTHIANKGDLITLLHVIPHPSSSSSSSYDQHHHHPHHHNHHSHPHHGSSKEDALNLASSLGSLCKASKPEVEVEALVIQGSKLATVLSQVKKLEASVLVLGQSKPSLFSCLFRSSSEDFVKQCINKAECSTLAVRKQSMGIGKQSARFLQ